MMYDEVWPKFGVQPDDDFAHAQESRFAKASPPTPRVGRQRQEHDVVWHDETRRTVPSGTVEDQQCDGAEADDWLISARCLFMTSMLTVGK